MKNNQLERIERTIQCATLLISAWIAFGLWVICDDKNNFLLVVAGVYSITSLIIAISID